jgi:hypothetical protein
MAVYMRRQLNLGTLAHDAVVDDRTRGELSRLLGYGVEAEWVSELWGPRPMNATLSANLPVHTGDVR